MQDVDLRSFFLGGSNAPFLIEVCKFGVTLASFG
jgi:hypothetical protein